MNQRYDLVVWGATGFTGQLLTEFIVEQYGIAKTLNWAIAGRNKKQLTNLKQKLACSKLPILLADSEDPSSLNQLASATRVIVTTVGPYALYGEALVKACVENGTHYCDLAGETQWIRKMIDRYHAEAQSKQCKIVHCCGFDSIPSDLGVMFLQNHAYAEYSQFVDHIKCRVTALKGQLSGGTLASMLNIKTELHNTPALYKVLSDPYALNPEGNRDGQDVKDLRTVKFDSDFQGWITPFMMAAINTRVVRRSHALANFPYGQSFKYDEAVLTGKGWQGRCKSWLSLLLLAVLLAGRPGGFYQRLIKTFLPKPGQGPNKTNRENGFWQFTLRGKCKNGQSITVKIKGDRDPGYGCTARMLGETAVCLALDTEKLPKTYGCLTPATAGSLVLLDRLEHNAGVSFRVIQQ